MSELRFELESPGLQLEGRNLVWVTVNRGDIVAQPGEAVDTVQVFRRPAPVDVRWGDAQPEQVDTTPWQYDVANDREIAPGTAYTARFPLDWGLADGHYGATVSVQRGEHDVFAEIYFQVE